MLKKHLFLQYIRDLDYVTLCTNIHQNRPNILQKTALKSMLRLRSILEPTWLHFGRVLGVKMEPRWHEIAPKIDPKIKRKNDHLLDRPKTDFWTFWSPTWPPRGETNPTISEHFSVLVPSWAQELPQDPHKTPQDASKTPLASIF